MDTGARTGRQGCCARRQRVWAGAPQLRAFRAPCLFAHSQAIKEETEHAEQQHELGVKELKIQVFDHKYERCAATACRSVQRATLEADTLGAYP